MSETAFIGSVDLRRGMSLSGVARELYGGERGIRTLDRVSPIHAFQACAFNHSAISPEACSIRAASSLTNGLLCSPPTDCPRSIRYGEAHSFGGASRLSVII